MHPDQGTTGDESLLAAWEELAAEAQARPLLLKPLTQRGAALAARYALWKERLGRLRPGQRKRLQRRLGMSLAGAALLLALAATPGLGAPAAAITVTNGTGTIANGDGCSLPEAIINANANNQSGSTDCVSGAAGLDTITLQTNIGLTAALPPITSAITIEGGGNTISRTSGTFRILAVTSGGNLTLNSATISGGIASGSFPNSAGGGIYARNATLAVSNSTVSGNSATSHGGGIFALSATLAVSNSSISGNLVSSGFGGGILASFAKVTVTNSTLSGNTASGGGSLGRGGGIYTGIATLTIVNSTLSGNSGMWGGGTFAYSSSLAITNSTLSGNLASSGGGGIYARRATLAVSNSTLSGNSAGVAGGGIYLYLIGGAITALNSIVASQTAGEDCNTALTSGGYNIESGTSCGFTGTGDQQSVSSGSLNLKPLANTGGPTETRALGFGSVALDQIPTGTNGCGDLGQTDQRGITRPQDWGAIDSPVKCDVGAWEGQPNPPNAVTLARLRAAPAGAPAGWWAAALVGLGGLGLSAFVARRRSWRRPGSGPAPAAPSSAPQAEDATSPSSYTPPAISSRGQLKHFAGSPLAVDPLALTEP